MLKTITILMLFASFIANSNNILGQLNTFSGQIIDHDGVPVTNAKVRIVGYDIIKTTDEVGLFQFNGAKEVNYTIDV
ncbi:MAG: hypothetical protein CMP20_01355, partial [Rickettsiales bacterium]|nr:hypothetical protein [Rickettsiales bacterium]